MERHARLRRYPAVFFGRADRGGQSRGEIFWHAPHQGPSGREREIEFERAGGPFARRRAGIHRGGRHHGRPRAGGDEGQVSAPGQHAGASHRVSSIVDPASYTPGFSYRGSRLFCEGVAVEEVAERFGTPAYLYSRASIEQAYRRM